MLKNSVQDNNLSYIDKTTDLIPERLDNSYMEAAIFNLFKINILNLIQIKAALAKEFHILPSELEIMPYWEYEIFVKYINDQVKEQNERQLAEMDKYHVLDTIKNINSGNFNKVTKNMDSSIQMPKMNVPNPNMSNLKF